MSDDSAEGERAIFRVGGQSGAGAGGAGAGGGGAGTPPTGGPATHTTTTTTPADPPTIWHKGFAITSAIVIALLLGAFVVMSQLFADNLGLDAAETAKLDGRALIGARVIGPVTVVGVAVTLFGVWMAMTEWRGRFTKAPTATGEREIPDPSRIIEALGKLRGAALVLVSGIVILLGVAWMTSATASAPPAPSPTSTATASPTT
ncbi:hypothetical protein [Humibacillus xanthopallidus]|uniref:hypothetical protein n=1 Tax=Humibacillus xanthopallidus TaxID=412689 RepID=UPI00384E3F4E